MVVGEAGKLCVPSMIKVSGAARVGPLSEVMAAAISARRVSLVMLWLLAGLRSKQGFERSFPAGGEDVEPDLNFIGDGSKICPGSFTNSEISAPDHEGTIKTGVVALNAHRSRRGYGLRAALDGELARYFVTVAAQRPDAAGFKAGGGECLGIEP